MRYSHRNGGKSPPTVQGWYWFKGTIDHMHNGTPIRVNATGIGYLHSKGFWIHGRDYHLKFCRGRWWGPVNPPWDSPVLENEAEVDMSRAEIASYYQAKEEDDGIYRIGAYRISPEGEVSATDEDRDKYLRIYREQAGGDYQAAVDRAMADYINAVRMAAELKALSDD